MCNALKKQIDSLRQGEHLCLVYENAVEQMAAVVPFMRRGLALGERCVYVADERTVDEILEALAGGGVDVAGERQRDALVLLTKRDAYLRCWAVRPPRG